MDFEKRTKSDNYIEAKKRVEEIKGFYIHLLVYVLVNIFISTVIIVGGLKDGDTLSEVLFDFPTFAVWLFWGIGVFFHAWGVFGKKVFFSKSWEERKLKQFIEEDKEQSKRLLK